MSEKFLRVTKFYEAKRKGKISDFVVSKEEVQDIDSKRSNSLDGYCRLIELYVKENESDKEVETALLVLQKLTESDDDVFLAYTFGVAVCENTDLMNSVSVPLRYALFCNTAHAAEQFYCDKHIASSGVGHSVVVALYEKAKLHEPEDRKGTTDEVIKRMKERIAETRQYDKQQSRLLKKKRKQDREDTEKWRKTMSYDNDDDV